jgi:hypothetical protein
MSRSAAALAFLCIATSSCDDAANDAAKGAESSASSVNDAADAARAEPPFGYLARVDALIEKDEAHFAELYQITRGGENAEAYWNSTGDRLVLQRRETRESSDCDRIYLTGADGALTQVSDGRGVTTCAYFMPGDGAVIFASTGKDHVTCPGMPTAPAGVARGYMWALHPEYELYVHDLATNTSRALTNSPGYDAEATLSPLGDRIVFTSTRSGDVELWTCAIDGSDPVQVTNEVGYDGGAFFSHDGAQLVFRSTEYLADSRDADVDEYRRLLAANLVKPSRMELYVCNSDGTARRKLTQLGGANFAPFFTPDDSRVIFASNFENAAARGPFFDLFTVPVAGGPHGPEDVTRITTYSGFDSFPMFSPDGKWLAFSSNRGGATEGETNVFVARWKD